MLSKNILVIITRLKSDASGNISNVSRNKRNVISCPLYFAFRDTLRSVVYSFLC